jgi:hypothetical protein
MGTRHGAEPRAPQWWTATDLRERARRVLWIGGRSGAGESTIARQPEVPAYAGQGCGDTVTLTETSTGGTFAAAAAPTPSPSCPAAGAAHPAAEDYQALPRLHLLRRRPLELAGVHE